MGRKRDISIPPKREDYRNEASYQDALRRYNEYRRAQYVWRQISLEERAWVLNDAGVQKPEELMRNDDLSTIRMSRKQMKKIGAYPNSRHRRELYRQKLAASTPSQDVYVRRHEKHLKQTPPKYRLSRQERAELRERQHRLARIKRKRRAGRFSQ